MLSSESRERLDASLWPRVIKVVHIFAQPVRKRQRHDPESRRNTKSLLGLGNGLPVHGHKMRLQFFAFCVTQRSNSRLGFSIARARHDMAQADVERHLRKSEAV